MLVELMSKVFRDSVIKFHPSLNVVLGDEKATNSIGKSSLLMVLDFVFGGNSLLEHNSDIVDELGHHDYFFTFLFDGDYYYFKRGTYTPDLVYECDDEYNEIEYLSVEKYRGLLESFYKLEGIDLSFRGVVSLYSRVWGKENYEIKQPLHSHKNKKAVECIDDLLKLYRKYGSIKMLNQKVKELDGEKAAIRSAFKYKVIPKITKSKYKENIRRESEIDEELKDIKNNLAKYAVNISEIVNREVSELKSRKDSLLRERSKVSVKLNRVRSDLTQNKHVKSKSFSSLVKFFPDIDQLRISEIEEFHSKITRILKKELRESEGELSQMLGEIDESIGVLDRDLTKIFSNLEKPDVIVDRVHDLAGSKIGISQEIHYFESNDRLNDELKDAKQELANEKASAIELVQNIINDKIRQYVKKVYDEERRSPMLELSQRSYTFTAFEDTGTGKAYSNLILFDLAVFETTKLPLIIHDSFLFKNIENSVVAKMIEIYLLNPSQSFIAIDEIQKYGEDAKRHLLHKKVIQLSNEKVLYNKDWRK